ncbi:MAG TPA: zf-HC2 domain-containing protein [Thermoanaerobaculia bacterium]|nr:zf-HC2 domain-containing protein [Thermoanaerobaculia bacterium]
MTKHLASETLGAYLDGDAADRAAIEKHLLGCLPCRAALEEVRKRVDLLGDPGVWTFLESGEAAEEDPRVDDLARAIARVTQAAADADAFYAQLARWQEAHWLTVIERNPQQITPQLIERFIHATMPELDRDPEHVLRLLAIAESIAEKLSDAECRLGLGHVWKQRSNALRQLARYGEAVDAAMRAEQLYVSVPNADFDVGQAQYTVAVALFKMTRYADALAALLRARGTLEDFGASAPLAKTMMLEALIRIEQGDIAPARETLRRLLPIEERLGQPLDAARVRANLAECNLRLGDLDHAIAEAEAAVAAYRALGNTVEEWRAEWTLAMIRLARGDKRALARLYEVAAVFERLAMVGDAGFVKLDIVEELLRQGAWAAAARIARDLATLFTAAGVTIASVYAVTFLREAVEKGAASAATVQYVRAFVAADDPSRAFEPPGPVVN